MGISEMKEETEEIKLTINNFLGPDNKFIAMFRQSVSQCFLAYHNSICKQLPENQL